MHARKAINTLHSGKYNFLENTALLKRIPFSGLLWRSDEETDGEARGNATSIASYIVVNEEELLLFSCSS